MHGNCILFNFAPQNKTDPALAVQIYLKFLFLKSSILKAQGQSGTARMLLYVSNSILSTGVDFLLFHISLTTFLLPAVSATLVGNVMGAITSYLFLRYVVFADASPKRFRTRMFWFCTGVALILLSNVAIVAILHHLCGFSAWPARIMAAVMAWYVGYFFNKNVVFSASTPTYSEKKTV